jgi:hypothetical protein
MAPRRAWILVAVPVIAVAFFALSGGTAGAGPAAPQVTPSITDSPSPSPTTTPCEISDLEFAFFMIDDNGQPHQLETGSTPPITYGDPVAYGAALTYQQGFDVSDQPIEIHRVIFGTSDDRILTLNTDSDGVASTVDVPRYSAYYHAEWHGTGGNCDGVDLTAGDVLNGVRVSITISSSDYTPNAGQTFLVRGGVAPNHPGKYVTVQWKRVGSSTISSSNVTLDSLSHWHKAFVSSSHGARWQFRAIFPKQDQDHQANVTGWIAVTVN